jgi:predicted nucleic acid-binding Zn ribbon protein
VRFCEKCGVRMNLICPACGATIPPDRQFCGQCGQVLAAPSAAKKDEKTVDPGERKHVTVLFSDLSGYTAMSEKLDPEEVKEITTRIFGEVAKIVDRYEGFVEKYIGDAVVALFRISEAARRRGRQRSRFLHAVRPYLHVCLRPFFQPSRTPLPGLRAFLRSR